MSITGKPSEVVAEFEGFTVTLTRSQGKDGAVVIFVDGPGEEAEAPDLNEDGSPGCRILLNDDPTYVGTPYVYDDSND